MQFIRTYEGFKKEYMSKIDVKDFKKIKKGSTIQYMGSTVKVIDNNGYVLTLKGEDGKKFTVNKNQFDHGGRISESIIDDLEAIGAQIDYLNDADKPTKKIWKKAGFDTEDDNMIILYSYPNDWYDVTKLLDKKKVKYKELEDPNSAGESFIVFKESEDINEMYVATQLANMLLDDIRNGKRKGVKPPTADEIQKLASRLGKKRISKRDVQEVIDDWDFMVNQAKGETQRNKMFGVTAKVFEATITFTKPIDLTIFTDEDMEDSEIESYKRGDKESVDVLNDNGGVIDVQFDDGSVSSIPKSVIKIKEGRLNELNSDEEIYDLWKKYYGENFISEYPAVAKILKSKRTNLDRRELARIWKETYGEDMKKEYPAFFDNLK